MNTEQPTPMTPEEFAAAMLRIAETAGDKELRHIEADQLLCHALSLLGYGEGVRIFDEISKWYA